MSSWLRRLLGERKDKTRLFLGTLHLPSPSVSFFDPSLQECIETPIVESTSAKIFGHMATPRSDSSCRAIELEFAPGRGTENREIGRLELSFPRAAVADSEWRRYVRSGANQGLIVVHAWADPAKKSRELLTDRFGVRWRERKSEFVAFESDREYRREDYESMVRAILRAKGRLSDQQFVFCRELAFVTTDTSDQLFDFVGSGFVPIGQEEGPFAFVATFATQGDYVLLGEFADERLVRCVLKRANDVDHRS